MYAVLNIGFAVALAIVMLTTQSVWLALALVVMSKWRVFAVRIRYWFVNVQSNLVDFVVSLSVVFFMYYVVTATITDVQKWSLLAAMTVLYIVWLLFIKPRSSRSFVVLQAGIALFGGVTVLFSQSFAWPVSLVVVVMWLIGYSASRHVLSSYDETYLLPLSLVWGTIMAEIGWVAYHWTVGYHLPIVSGLYVPQVAIIVTLVSFVVFKSYDSFYHHQKIRTTDIILPLIFSIALILVLLVFFNGLDASI